MDASDSIGLVLFGFALLLSAVFSAAETALFAANRSHLRERAEGGDRRAALVGRLLDDPGRTLSTLLVADTIANVGAAVLAAGLAARVLAPGWAAATTFLVVVVLLLTVGEFVPKSIAGRDADRVALWLARPIAVVAGVLSPIIRLMSLLSRLLVLPLRARVSADTVVTEEEIRLLVQRGEEEGVIEQDERDMIHSIFEFGDTVAREVMVPRIDMEVLADDAPVSDALELIQKTGYSRVPIFHETIDNIVGILYWKDLLKPVAEGRHQAPVVEFARPPYFVPESKGLDELIREMQRRKVQMAIVVDEYGGTSGLVTMEDLLEEIVGPIHDEHDVEEKLVEVINDRVALVDGRMNIEEVNAHLELALPVGEVDTVGGFVYSLLGHVPQPGERVRHDGVEITVEELDGQRISKVKISRVVPSVP